MGRYVTGPPDDYTSHLKEAAHEVLSMTNIVERLRAAEKAGCWTYGLMSEAAAEIERLRAALKPFAVIGVPEAWAGTAWEHRGDPVIVCRDIGVILRADFEEARRALEPKQ